MHELLTAAAAESPVAGNAHGSYLTMRSKNGLIFGGKFCNEITRNIQLICFHSNQRHWKLYALNLVIIVSSLNRPFVVATVFEDQSYWQRAIASRPASCVRGYLYGGLAWYVLPSCLLSSTLPLFRFAIPFMFSTTLGLAAVALRNDPAMKVLTPADVSAGLPAPSAAAALMGQSGAAALLVVLFLAVTSATSAELIAVSSILTYDVYKVRSIIMSELEIHNVLQKYFNPKATDQQILRVSHAMVHFYFSLIVRKDH